MRYLLLLLALSGCSSDISPKHPLTANDLELKQLRTKNAVYEMMLTALATPCECERFSKVELLDLIKRSEHMAFKALNSH